jgi:hypothetical protein
MEVLAEHILQGCTELFRFPWTKNCVFFSKGLEKGKNRGWQTKTSREKCFYSYSKLTKINTQVATNTSVVHPELPTRKEWRSLDFLAQIKHCE